MPYDYPGGALSPPGTLGCYNAANEALANGGQPPYPLSSLVASLWPSVLANPFGMLPLFGQFSGALGCAGGNVIGGADRGPNTSFSAFGVGTSNGQSFSSMTTGDLNAFYDVSPSDANTSGQPSETLDGTLGQVFGSAAGWSAGQMQPSGNSTTDSCGCP